jgi:NAD(P)H-dependent FMN reductase
MAAIGVILASVREVRRGEAFAKWLLELAQSHANLDAELVDLRDWPLPAYTYGVLPTAAEKLYVDGSLQSRWAERIRGFDGFIVVTPEYNRGYPGQLKHALDALYQAWNYKPVAWLAYGGAAGGSRAASQLAQVAVELKMVPLREEVCINLIGLAVDAQGYPTAELYTKKAQLLLTELGYWTQVLKSGREHHPR